MKFGRKKLWALNSFEALIVENVAKHGCHINAVRDEDAPYQTFAYSIGFTKTVGAPEIILFGLPDDVYAPAVNWLLVSCAGGFVISEGQRISGVFGEYDCIARIVHETWLDEEYFNSALWFHRTQMQQPLQDVAMLVWPDAEHRFPWDDGCADWVRASQPALYNPRLNS